MPHEKEHNIAGTDHLAGTNETVIGTRTGAITQIPFAVAPVAANLIMRDGNQDCQVPLSPSSDGAAVSRYYVNQLISGRHLPVAVLKMITDANQGGAPPAAPPYPGAAYVVNNWGGGHNDGDIEEWTGAGWTVIVANSGGTPPDGTRVVVAGVPAPGGSFAAKGNNYATFRTATSTWTFLAPNDGDEAVVYGNDSYFENMTYVWDSVPGLWRSMGSVIQHNDLVGLQGGVASQYYHLSSAQYTQAIKKRVSLTEGVNAFPNEAVLIGASWALDDWGFYRTSLNGKSWLVWYRAVGNVEYVQL